MTNHHKNTSINSYLVGGAVRDQLLGRDIIERDYVVVGSTIDQMLSLGFSQVGKDFPVFLHPKTKEEYALARTEKKHGQGYTGFVCHASECVTLEEDLLRRDLTVNAMALDQNGIIIDPFNGQQDLNDRILRHVSPAFVEDPLRVLRVARFAARYHYLGFSIADETLALMQSISRSGELKTLSAERVYQEIARALGEKNPEVFFQVLHACGALNELWPELDKLWHRSASNNAVFKSNAQLTLSILKQAVTLSDKLSVRFSCVCLYIDQADHTFDNISKQLKILAANPLSAMVTRLKVPNQVKQLIMKSYQYHHLISQAFKLSAKDILNLFDQLDVWRKAEFFDDFLTICYAEKQALMAGAATDFAEGDYLKSLLGLCAKVSAKTYVEQGFTGQAIKQAIKTERLTIITNYNR